MKTTGKGVLPNYRELVGLYREVPASSLGTVLTTAQWPWRRRGMDNGTCSPGGLRVLVTMAMVDYFGYCRELGQPWGICHAMSSAVEKTAPQ